MMNPTQMGTFEETFGENKGNDAVFFLDEEGNEIAVKAEKPLTPDDILNEIDLLAYETIDKDSVEKNLEKVLDWLKKSNGMKFEDSFETELGTRFDVLLANILDQLKELDYNATSRLRASLRRMPEIDVIKDAFEKFDKENNLTKTLDKYFNEHVSRLVEQSKNIKKKKKIDKKQKLYEAEKQERMTKIEKTNALFAADDLAMKKEPPKSEAPKSEYRSYDLNI